VVGFVVRYGSLPVLVDAHGQVYRQSTIVYGFVL
jgi:hypothetical protein